jgi:hypothetical protein
LRLQHHPLHLVVDAERSRSSRTTEHGDHARATGLPGAAP